MEPDDQWEVLKGIDYTLEHVAEKGWYDKGISIDNFAVLREDRHICDAQVTALYEEYFLPNRHEHEWQLLTQVVYAIVNSPVLEFSALAIVSGVIGNTAYDLIKKLCYYVADQYDINLGDQAKARANGFREIANDAGKIQQFFMNKKIARIFEIENSTGISRERIYPLLKIAGLIHHRTGDKTCYWESQ